MKKELFMEQCTILDQCISAFRDSAETCCENDDDERAVEYIVEALCHLQAYALNLTGDFYLNHSEGINETHNINNIHLD